MYDLQTEVDSDCFYLLFDSMAIKLSSQTGTECLPILLLLASVLWLGVELSTFDNVDLLCF